MKLVDKKVMEYLDRARKISNKLTNPCYKSTEAEAIAEFECIVEIAKMLQAEEHFNPWEDK